MNINLDNVLRLALQQGDTPPHSLNENIIAKMSQCAECRNSDMGVLRSVYRKRAVCVAICFIAVITIFREPLLLCAKAISGFVMEKYEMIKYAGLINDDSIAIKRSENGYIIVLDKVYYSEHEVVASISVIGDEVGDFMREEKTTQSPVYVSFATKQGDKIFNNQTDTMIVDNIQLKEKILNNVISADSFNYSDYYNLTVSWRGDEFLFEGELVPLKVDILTSSNKYERIIFDVEFAKGMYYKEKVVELNNDVIADGMEYRITKAIDTMTGLAICIDTSVVCPESYIKVYKDTGEVLKVCEVVEINTEKKIIHYAIPEKEYYPKYDLNIANKEFVVEFTRDLD